MGTNSHVARAIAQVMSDVTSHAPAVAAKKMRLLRQRRRAGMRVATVDLGRDETDALIRQGYLPEADARSGPPSIALRINGRAAQRSP